MTITHNNLKTPRLMCSNHQDQRTACSRTSSFGLISRRTKMGTAPFSMTTRVWSLVPLAMLVNAQADSNCSAGLSSRWRNSTNLGTTPASITFWIGGLRSGKISDTGQESRDQREIGRVCHEQCSSPNLASIPAPPLYAVNTCVCSTRKQESCIKPFCCATDPPPTIQVHEVLLNSPLDTSRYGITLL